MSTIPRTLQYAHIQHTTTSALARGEEEKSNIKEVLECSHTVNMQSIRRQTDIRLALGETRRYQDEGLMGMKSGNSLREGNETCVCV